MQLNAPAVDAIHYMAQRREEVQELLRLAARVTELSQQELQDMQQQAQELIPAE